MYLKNGHGKPATEIRILAIPSILVKKPREADRDYEARTKKLFLGLSDVGKLLLVSQSRISIVLGFISEAMTV